VIALCRHAGFSPRIVNKPNFMATVLALVESALGISLVPRCVRSLNRPVAIRAIAPKSARIPLFVTWRKSSENPVVSGFLERAATRDQKADEKIDPSIERSCLTKNFYNTKILGVHGARTQQRFSVAPAESSSG